MVPSSSNKAGEAIFGMDAASFDVLDKTVQGDIIEGKTESNISASSTTR